MTKVFKYLQFVSQLNVAVKILFQCLVASIECVAARTRSCDIATPVGTSNSREQGSVD